jgi:hypothetical protein
MAIREEQFQGIGAAEFGARRSTAAAAARDRGYSGLVVWSRGGTTVDYYGDVLYLTNHHSTFPNVNDSPGAWAARGHAVLLLRSDGRAVLLTDYYDDPDDRVRIEDVRVVTDLPRAAADVVRGLEMDGGPLGLVGRNVDQWGPVENYYTDFARSTVVGRRPTDAQREVLDASVALIPKHGGRPRDRGRPSRPRRVELRAERRHPRGKTRGPDSGLSGPVVGLTHLLTRDALTVW